MRARFVDLFFTSWVVKRDLFQNGIKQMYSAMVYTVQYLAVHYTTVVIRPWSSLQTSAVHKPEEFQYLAITLKHGNTEPWTITTYYVFI